MEIEVKPKFAERPFEQDKDMFRAIGIWWKLNLSFSDDLKHSLKVKNKFSWLVQNLFNSWFLDDIKIMRLSLVHAIASISSSKMANSLARNTLVVLSWIQAPILGNVVKGHHSRCDQKF